jgi:hypothetical protein
VLRLCSLVVLSGGLAGCVSGPESAPALRQQAQADLVVNFQSWNAIAFVKPDITGAAGGLAVRAKTFTGPAFEKLLSSLKTPRGFVVVILDRRYNPDPMTAHGGIDAIEQFFGELGFHRIAFQDSLALDRPNADPILKDVTLKQPE